MATGYLVSQHHLSMTEAAAIAVAAATLAGLVLGLLVVALSVPAWAVTLGAVPLLEAFAAWSRESIDPDAGFGLGISYYEAFGACAVLTAGGALWLLGVHRSPGRYAAVGGMAGSCLLAGLTGVFVLSITKTAAPVGTFDTYLTIAALGAVLLGGESLLGRGGGVLGVVFAVLILPGVQGLLLLHDAGTWAGEAVSGGAVVLGLGVHRLLDLGSAYAGRVRASLRRAGTANSREESAAVNAADPSAW
jgi:ribose/xylose/arabinose/galactoside ABC-type transport system permease subunit